MSGFHFIFLSQIPILTQFTLIDILHSLLLIISVSPIRCYTLPFRSTLIIYNTASLSFQHFTQVLTFSYLFVLGNLILDFGCCLNQRFRTSCAEAHHLFTN